MTGSVSASEPLGLIAGNGRFPFLVAEAARKGGRRIVLIKLKEETDDGLEALADETHEISLGQLGSCIAALRKAGAREAIMAGQVRHRQIFSGIVPDLTLMGVLARLAFKNTDSLIGGVADALEREGIRLMSSVELLRDQLADEGSMSGKKPSGDEQKAIDYGVRIATELGRLDLGQTVVVKDRAVVALEAMEGTDEAIARGARIAGPGVVVVKMAKPRQDMRFDVPVVGERTLQSLRDAKASVLAVEAGKTLLLEKPAFLASAKEMGVVVVGVARKKVEESAT
ncbi:MAG TPA: UDP-2,3-diacylglucosamine diphosphatase LpxI [Vicinamibacteria bacterium]|nr:UDP-2,3-diacylglucosamine diphosphatase LpxI [Vicinamibacteria bacterium]